MWKIVVLGGIALWAYGALSTCKRLKPISHRDKRLGDLLEAASYRLSVLDGFVSAEAESMTDDGTESRV